MIIIMGSFAISIDDQEDSPIPAVKHYHPGVCSVCYVVPSQESNLLRCAQCQIISYCSKACQKIDWPTHRSLCLMNKAKEGNIFSSLKEMIKNEKGDSDLRWYQLRCDLALACSINLKRSLCTREREMFLFPRVCEVCKDSISPILSECNMCHSVFYCCDEHRDKDKIIHSSWCSLYLHCLECDAFEAKHGIQDLPFPTLVDGVYKPLHANLTTILNEQLEADSNRTLDRRCVTMIGERLSFPFSLLYALEKLNNGIDNSMLNASTLRIHVIGAESSVELLGIIRWEYLLHRLPSVKRLHIVFIGPNLLNLNENMEEVEMENHYKDDSGATRCEDCTKRGRMVIYEMADMLYHEFIDSDYYNDPDVIVAFNCGFHEYENNSEDTWKESLKLVLCSQVPLIFTSYTKLEAEKDLKVVKSNGEVEIIIEPHLNPFKSPRPFRDPARDDKKQIYFYNQYLACVRGIDQKSFSISEA